VVDEPVGTSLREFFNAISISTLNKVSESIAKQDRYRFRADSDFERFNVLLEGLLSGAEQL